MSNMLAAVGLVLTCVVRAYVDPATSHGALDVSEQMQCIFYNGTFSSVAASFTPTIEVFLYVRTYVRM